jgi:thioredoxin reductase (NADPH)
MEILYDCIIIGGGPAGLSAAIYLGRFLRKVLVVDQKQGRSSWAQINENYLGFPNGVKARRLRALGKKQAQKFGAEFLFGNVVTISKEKEIFLITLKSELLKAKSIILCTGVKDRFPQFQDYKEYIGKSLLWCITCDGYKTIDKSIIVIGSDDEAAVTCMQFLTYTNKITFLTNCDKDKCKISDSKIENLKKADIPIHICKLGKVIGNDGWAQSIKTETNETIEVDLIFSLQGAIPNMELTQSLGVKLNKDGYIITDSEQRTNIPFVYAAGDVTRLFSHQIITAAHEGSMAAQSANYDLYSPNQKS